MGGLLTAILSMIAVVVAVEKTQRHNRQLDKYKGPWIMWRDRKEEHDRTGRHEWMDVQFDGMQRHLICIFCKAERREPCQVKEGQ